MKKYFTMHNLKVRFSVYIYKKYFERSYKILDYPTTVVKLHL